MNERTMQLRLGITVLASIVIIIILLTFLGSQNRFSSGGYHIYIQLADAPGVMENTPIYQSGILIGRVHKVELVKDKGVLVTARIFRDRKLYHDQQCNLTTTLLGDASLRMVKIPLEEGAPKPDSSEVEPGETLLGKVAFDPVVIVGKMQERLTVAIDDVSRAAIQLEKVAQSTDAMIQKNDANITSIVENAQSITTDSRAIVHNFSEILDDDFRDNLQQSAAALPLTLAKIDDTLDTMKGAVTTAADNVNASMAHMSKRMDHSMDMVDHSLENVQKITDPMAAKTENWVENIDSLLQNVDVLVENLNNPNSTLGLLMRDRQLYDNLVITTERIGDIPRQVQPILFNARVFSEKIAQHPELLGVRGAMNPSSGTSSQIPWPKGITLGAGNNSNDYTGMETTRPSILRSAPEQAPTRYVPPTYPRDLPARTTQPQTSQAPTPQAPTPQTLKPADSSADTYAATTPMTAREVTPEMLGMTPEEFQNADISVLSDRVLRTGSAPVPPTIALPEPEPELDILELKPADSK